MVQLSHPYMTTEKNIALTRWTFVSKAMSLLFNTLSRFVIAFLPRSKSFNYMAAVTICSDFGAQKNKVSHCVHCFPIYLLWSDGTGCHDLSIPNVLIRCRKLRATPWAINKFCAQDLIFLDLKSLKGDTEEREWLTPILNIYTQALSLGNHLNYWAIEKIQGSHACFQNLTLPGNSRR